MSQLKNNKFILAVSLAILFFLGIFFLALFEKRPASQEGASRTQESLVFPSSLSYAERTILTSQRKQFALSVPQGFNITLAASGLGRARFIAKSPDGRLFVTDMKNLSDNQEGKIYALHNFNKNTGEFGAKAIYLSGLRNPNSLAFYEDKDGQHWLYVALTDKLIRYKFTLGEISPSGVPEILATFPDYGLDYKYGGWHLTRTVAIEDDVVYVSIGSSCNSCEEKEDIRASVIRMNPDGSDQKFVARGLRNAVGLSFKNGDLYGTAMGSDHLGNDKPEEMLYKIKPGTHYGWPYCYEYAGKIYPDDAKSWGELYNCSKVPLADATFPAHSAPLGLAYFNEDGNEDLRNSFLVALHGSGKVSLGSGYSIVRVDEEGKVENFITGFLKDGERYGRPVDILRHDNDSFFFTDDFGGNLYFVYKEE